MTSPFTAGQKVRAATLNAGLEDTGWIALAAEPGSGFTGVTGWVRRIGKLVDVSFIGGQNVVYPTNFVITTLPVGSRATRELWRVGTFWTGVAHFGIRVATDGKIVMADGSGGVARTGVVLGFTFTI